MATHPSLLERPLPKLLVLVAANVLLLALLVAGLELVSSFFVVKPSSNMVYDYRLNHTWRPASTARIDAQARRNPDYPDPYTLHFNRQGWIETYDVDQTKADNVFRIFYVGDSFTAGATPMESSVPSIVERGLNAMQTGDGRRFEVINTGTPSYSPTIYYVLLSQVLFDYAPDLIVLNVDMTDDFDDWKYRDAAVLDESGNLVAVPPRNLFAADYIDTERGPVPATLSRRVALFLHLNSYTYHFVQRVSARLFGPPRVEVADPATDLAQNAYPRFAWCQHEWTEETERNVQRTLDLLRRVGELAQENGVKLMIGSVPHYRQFSRARDGTEHPEWSDRPHREIGHVAAELGVPYLNALEALRPMIQGSAPTDFYYANDMHFNPRGNEVWAAAHLDFLTDPAHALLE